MANVLIEETYLEEIADAIRAKNGLSTVTYKPSQMATAITNIETSGGTSSAITANDALRALLDRSLEGIEENTITTVGKYAFAGAENLTSVNLDAVTAVNDYAFQGCSAMSNIDLPSVKNVGNYAFANCSALTNVKFPVVDTVGSYVFSNCSNLTNLDLSSAYAFGDYAFANCPNLTTVKLNNNSGILGSQMGNYIFAGTKNLELVDFGYCPHLGSNAFGYSSSTTHILPNLILRYQGVVAYSNTGITGIKTDCYVYVPKAYVSNYKSSSLWGGLKDNIRAIEDYPNICG